LAPNSAREARHQHERRRDDDLQQQHPHA
jgi:hypothetical protein